VKVNGMQALSNTIAITKAFPNRWFIREMGQVIRSDKPLSHGFEVRQWISLV
jgi:RNA-directed DNA polymerase